MSGKVEATTFHESKASAERVFDAWLDLVQVRFRSDRSGLNRPLCGSSPVRAKLRLTSLTLPLDLCRAYPRRCDRSGGRSANLRDGGSHCDHDRARRGTFMRKLGSFLTALPRAFSPCGP
jgi:hypothetical protein